MLVSLYIGGSVHYPLNVTDPGLLLLLLTRMAVVVLATGNCCVAVVIDDVDLVRGPGQWWRGAARCHTQGSRLGRLVAGGDAPCEDCQIRLNSISSRK